MLLPLASFLDGLVPVDPTLTGILIGILALLAVVYVVSRVVPRRSGPAPDPSPGRRMRGRRGGR